MKNILWRLSALVMAGTLLTGRAQANIYATDVKLNGARNAITGVPPATNNITYILNEPATLGTTINITSGANLVRTISLGWGTNGTWMGANLVVWDNNDNNSNAVPTGNYIVRITPAASGYTRWTQISGDTNAGSHVWEPRGVAVNNNSNSIFYGRIFVGNAGTGPNPATTPGDNDTILKLNADGAFSDDGADGNGGYDIYDDGNQDLPQKLRVAGDDRLYMVDLTSSGQIVAFDMALRGYQIVLDQDNYIDNPYFSILYYGWFSMDVTGAGTTNGLIWLGDSDTNGAGIWNWHLTNGIADPNDTSGHQAVAVGVPLGVAVTGGLMVDTNSDIFVGQYLTDLGDTNAGCMVFTNWNGQPPTTSTRWSDVGVLGVYDTTLDSRQSPKYVACALNGGAIANGIQILNPLTGATLGSNLDPTNEYYATAWDNVGNLYAVTQSAHLLRVFSPPDGANQATTLAVIRVEPDITGITDNHTNVTVKFVASRSDTAGEFSLVSAPAITDSFTNTDATITQVSAGQFTVTTPASGPTQFYQISRTVGP